MAVDWHSTILPMEFPQEGEEYVIIIIIIIYTAAALALTSYPSMLSTSLVYDMTQCPWDGVQSHNSRFFPSDFCFSFCALYFSLTNEWILLAFFSHVKIVIFSVFPFLLLALWEVWDPNALAKSRIKLTKPCVNLSALVRTRQSQPGKVVG